MLSASARLLKTLSLLHGRRFWTGAELAEALGITERSVRRDVDALRELGYPVHASPGVGGGYALGAGQDLPPFPLDDDEAVAVALGLRAVASGWVTGLEQASVSALSKLEAVLPARLRRRLGDLAAVSRLGPHPGPRADGGLLATLAYACREERTLAFAYRDRAGTRTQREVEPHGLIHSQGRWYLVAWDRGRREWRSFRVDRVEADLAPGHPFRPRPLPAPDLGAWVSAGGAEAWRYRARVRVQAPADEVTRRVPVAYGRVTPLGEGSCELVTSGDDLGWLAAWLGLLGLELEVLEPPELKDTLRALSGRFARAAGDEVDGVT